ncbi:MAG: hypothetical protein RMJ37_06130 [Spirochaetia bacterium]|nr:hypothetical protein [Spirochaetota bacterium]MCX8096241.1 hypothetical protein [Spirochaetota bacterium]MDW8112891.1 hypothetical protein [Spirochaetia bacterium]
MEDTILILISTVGFILSLLNNLTLVLIGISIGVISIILLIIIKTITIVARVSVFIVSTMTISLGILWLIGI